MVAVTPVAAVAVMGLVVAVVRGGMRLVGVAGLSVMVLGFAIAHWTRERVAARRGREALRPVGAGQPA